MRLRDSLTGELKPVVPGADGVIGIYACGSTVYGRIHVGNARAFVVYQLMRRYLEWTGQPVVFVENITDVDDKVIVAARALGISSAELAQQMTDYMIEDTNRLGLGRPDLEPRATETIPEIVALIEELIAAGEAYEAGGDVYFAVRSFAPYGALSGQRPDELESSGRIEPGEHKRDPLDFAMWKAQKPDEDIAWDSPWGPGRPGWHIECSAMAEKYLGREFAVHGGGRDLIFPHHENELAQSSAAGRPFAQVWAHNGLLQLAGEKMSKSRGNIERLHDALDRMPAETFLMFLLRGHYAGPIDYTEDALKQAAAACATLREKLRSGTGSDPELIRKVREVLDDDFNTPRALALLFEAPPSARDSIVEVLQVFGLGGLAEDEEAPAEVVALAERRRAARAAGDYAESDALRDQIAGAGWVVRDTASGFELYPSD